MATSGTLEYSIYVAPYNYNDATIDWVITNRDYDAKTVTVRFSVKLLSRAGWSGDIDLYFGKNYSSIVNTANNALYVSEGLADFSYTHTFACESDGTCKFAPHLLIYDGADYWRENTSDSTLDFSLDATVSESTLSTTGGTLGNAYTLAVTRSNTTTKHTITYYTATNSSGTNSSYGGSIATKSTTESFSFTPALSLANRNTTGATIYIRYYVNTYDADGFAVGEKYTSWYAYAIPASIKPSITGLTWSENTSYMSKYGACVQDKSKLNISYSITGNLYGATIAKQELSVCGMTYTETSVVTDEIYESGTITITATVVDSRGRKATAETTVEVLPYTAPVISLLKVGRCDGLGVANDQGDYARVTMSAEVSPLNNKNAAVYTLQYKKPSDENYTTVSMTSYNGVYAITEVIKQFAADTGSTYKVIFTVNDDFHSDSVETSISTAAVLLHFSKTGHGIGIGKVSEEQEVLDIGFASRFYGGILQPVLDGAYDLDEITTPNTYSCDASFGYANSPVTSGTFTLEVMAAGDGSAIIQRITTNTSPVSQYTRICGGEWGSVTGAAGADGVGIASVTQTTVSTEDGGDNIITVRLTNGNTYNFTVKNGSTGEKGDKGDTGATGATGAKGADGVSVTHSWSGTTLNVTSASGTSSADLKGDKGDTGAKGDTGEKGDTGAKGDKGDKGDTGEKGATGDDGVSVTHSWNGTILSVTSASGTTSADLKGEKGEKGDTGEKGADGTMTFEDLTAEQKASLKGDKGDKGDTGDTGAAGYTPVKGTDYWTESDKAEIVQDVIDALPVYGGELA